MGSPSHRGRRARLQRVREEELLARATAADDRDLAQDQADAVCGRLLAALAALTAEERVALVLHDTLGVPLAEVAAIVGATPTATRAVIDRARHDLRGR